MPLPLSEEALSRLVKNWLHEDIGHGDITTNATIPENAEMSAALVARETMIVAGHIVAKMVFQALERTVQYEVLVKDGDKASKGKIIATLHGTARALLTGERTALNILQHLSGIATLTRQYTDAIEGTGAKLLDTRKTTPGLRILEKYATSMGGAQNHRMGLYDAVMIKDNHIAAAGGIKEAVNHLKKAGQNKIQVECDTLEQVKEALQAGATSLLLDNMPLETLKKAREIAPHIPLEASGGITLETIRAIAETGIDYISVGRLTQSAPAVDIGMDDIS